MNVKYMIFTATLTIFTATNAFAADEMLTENHSMKTEASKTKKQIHADEKSGTPMSEHAAKEMDKQDAMKSGMNKPDAMNMKDMGSHDHMMGGKH